MKIANTTGDFLFYCKTDEERIRELYRAGFRYVDFSMYAFTPDCVYMQDGWKDEVNKIKNLAQELGMEFVQAHSQGGNPLSDDKEHVDFLLKATIRSIEICEMLGIKNTVVHNGEKEGLTKDEWFALNKAFIKIGKPKIPTSRLLFLYSALFSIYFVSFFLRLVLQRSLPQRTVSSTFIIGASHTSHFSPVGSPE